MKIKTVCVIGTGTLGTQIALVSAAAGYTVRTFDARKNTLFENLADLKTTLEDKNALPKVPFDKWDDLVANIQQFSDLPSAVKIADLVIEAVSEDLEVKKEVFTKLGELTPPHAILSTNSSSLPVSSVEQCSGRPQLCLNLHFSRPLEGLMHVDLMGGQPDPSRGDGGGRHFPTVPGLSPAQSEQGNARLLFQPCLARGEKGSPSHVGGRSSGFQRY